MQNTLYKNSLIFINIKKKNKKYNNFIIKKKKYKQTIINLTFLF
jgi:hypothetical protein